MKLTEFLCKYGINSTTNFDLIDISYDLDFPLKVLMKNEIKKYLEKENEIGRNHELDSIPIILNYHNTNQKGIHWCGYFSKNNKGYYFDSYGLPPLKELEDYVTDYNEEQLQFETLEYCGQLSLYVLYKMYFTNTPFIELIKSMKVEIDELLS